MDSLPTQRTIGRLQRKQSHEEESYARRDRDLQDTVGAQERMFLQAGILPGQLLLLSLQDDSRADRRHRIKQSRKEAIKPTLKLRAQAIAKAVATFVLTLLHQLFCRDKLYFTLYQMRNHDV